jgi:hypothetical protein
MHQFCFIKKNKKISLYWSNFYERINSKRIYAYFLSIVQYRKTFKGKPSVKVSSYYYTKEEGWRLTH